MSIDDGCVAVITFGVDADGGKVYEVNLLMSDFFYGVSVCTRNLSTRS